MGVVSCDLPPTAITALLLEDPLLHDKQLSPYLEIFSVQGSATSDKVFFMFWLEYWRSSRLPSVDTMPSVNPNSTVGENFMSSGLAVFIDNTDHSCFWALLTDFHSYILSELSRVQAAKTVPYSGWAHLSFQTEAPWIRMELSSSQSSLMRI